MFELYEIMRANFLRSVHNFVGKKYDNILAPKSTYFVNEDKFFLSQWSVGLGTSNQSNPLVKENNTLLARRLL